MHLEKMIPNICIVYCQVSAFGEQHHPGPKIFESCRHGAGCETRISNLGLCLWPNAAEMKIPLPPLIASFCPSRYGFGEAGKPKYGIQANAELVYEVTLKSFEKVRAEVCWSLPRLQECRSLCSVHPLSLVWLQPGPC